MKLLKIIENYYKYSNIFYEASKNHEKCYKYSNTFYEASKNHGEMVQIF